MTLDAIDMFLKIEGGDFSFIRMLSVILESIHTYFLFLYYFYLGTISNLKLQPFFGGY